jgi:hypothetical protein
VAKELTARIIVVEIKKLLADLNREYELSYSLEKEFVAIQNECQLLIFSDMM